MLLLNGYSYQTSLKITSVTKYEKIKNIRKFYKDKNSTNKSIRSLITEESINKKQCVPIVVIKGKRTSHKFYDYGNIPSNILFKKPAILENDELIETEHAIPRSLLESGIMTKDSKLAGYIYLFMCGGFGSYIACGAHSNKNMSNKNRNIFTANIFERMLLNFNNSGYLFIKIYILIFLFYNSFTMHII